MQEIAYKFKGQVQACERREYGQARVSKACELDGRDSFKLLDGGETRKSDQFSMDLLYGLPDDFQVRFESRLLIGERSRRAHCGKMLLSQ